MNAREGLLAALALAPSLLFVDPLRHAIESHMPSHMLLEFPLLFASGWIVAGAANLRRRWPRSLDSVDVHGLLGLTFAGCALTLWMIPTSLDLALLSGPVRLGKYVSLWLAGLLLRRSQDRLSAELSIFLVGMLAWMLASVGLVFQTMPRRLCVNYLLDEQRWTGVGLVAAAVLLGTLGLWRIVVNRTGSAAGDDTAAQSSFASLKPENCQRASGGKKLR